MKPEEIDDAVAKGIITPEQATRLKEEAAAKAPKDPEPPQDQGDPSKNEEPFTFIDNFGSVFIVVGLVILQGAPWLFSATLDGVAVSLCFGVFALAFWGIAEVLQRKGRRLPSTVAALLFVLDATKAVLPYVEPLFERPVDPNQLGGNDLAYLVTAICFLVVVLLRFRLPLLVLVLALSMVSLAFKLLDLPTLWILSGCGITCILIGIALDLRDPNRSGSWHEYAMWLFVVGSPLAVHPLFITVIRERMETNAFDSGVVTIIILLAFAVSFVGLLLDRRSLVTSSLIYLAGSFSYLLVKTSKQPELLLSLIPPAIGTYVILLGIAWRPVRRKVLSALPGQALLKHLPRYT